MKRFWLILFLGWIGAVSAKGSFLPGDTLKPKKNSFFVSLGGKALLYSIGYERKIFVRESFYLSASVELGYAPFTGPDGIMVPVTVNGHFGKGKNKILVGISLGNYVDFTPFPKTKAEREQAKMDGTICTGHYEPPYKPYLIPVFGYERYFDNRNHLTFFFSPFIYSTWLPGANNLCYSKTTFFPWGGIKFNYFI